MIAVDKKRKGEGGREKIGADLQCRQLSIGAASAHTNGLPECLQVTSLQRRGFPHRMMSSLYIPPSLFLTYCQIHFLCTSLHTWAARVCAGGWDGFRKQVKIPAVCLSLGILLWCNPFPPLQPSQASPTQADLLPLSEAIWNVCCLGYHSQFCSAHSHHYLLQMQHVWVFSPCSFQQRLEKPLHAGSLHQSIGVEDVSRDWVIC